MEREIQVVSRSQGKLLEDLGVEAVDIPIIGEVLSDGSIVHYGDTCRLPARQQNLF